MAKNANANEPSDEHVQDAVQAIEGHFADLLKEKMAYMSRAKNIRGQIANSYDVAQDKGIMKKLLKKLVKEREYERKIAALVDDLENDEIMELEMLASKLGEFANTPLGAAAMSRAGKPDGRAVLASVGQ